MHYDTQWTFNAGWIFYKPFLSVYIGPSQSAALVDKEFHTGKHTILSRNYFLILACGSVFVLTEELYQKSKPVSSQLNILFINSGTVCSSVVCLKMLECISPNNIFSYLVNF